MLQNATRYFKVFKANFPRWIIDNSIVRKLGSAAGDIKSPSKKEISQLQQNLFVGNLANYLHFVHFGE